MVLYVVLSSCSSGPECCLDNNLGDFVISVVSQEIMDCIAESQSQYFAVLSLPQCTANAAKIHQNANGNFRNPSPHLAVIGQTVLEHGNTSSPKKTQIQLVKEIFLQIMPWFWGVWMGIRCRKVELQKWNKFHPLPWEENLLFPMSTVFLLRRPKYSEPHTEIQMLVNFLNIMYLFSRSVAKGCPFLPSLLCYHQQLNAGSKGRKPTQKPALSFYKMVL